MPYIPHTLEDTEAMLASIGVTTIDGLFDEIPSQLKYAGFKAIPDGINEMNLMKEAQRLANTNKNGICFLGAGAYEHHIPAAVWEITSRGEFLTAYTPYQAEASQGTLQLLYEFQTMICELTNLDVANASLYDGATAMAEAVLMAVRVNKHSKSNTVLVAGTIHPLYRETLETILKTQHIKIITLDFDIQKGITPLSAVEQYNQEDITALVIAQPNFFGCLEQVDELTNWAHQQNVISIGCVNPLSLALLNPPGSWGRHGVAIACGEAQPLGIPMASGGPYCGFISTRMEHVRQMPGRIIGQTVDKDGNRGFTLTLQAREQHIRRGKATSNICTNQGLLATAATVYMSLLGPNGLKQAALNSHQNTVNLVKLLTDINKVRLVFTSPYFHEALLQFESSVNVDDLLKDLAKSGIQAGFAPETYYPQLPNTLLICATEMRTAEEIEYYHATLNTILEK